LASAQASVSSGARWKLATYSSVEGALAPLHDRYPGAFNPGRVFDQAADGERARGRLRPGLLLGESVGLHPEHVSLLGEVGEQPVALVRDRWRKRWHAYQLLLFSTRESSHRTPTTLADHDGRAG
jgi:hypothetical protein